MEQPAKRSKIYHSASYLASAFVFYGALLFLLDNEASAFVTGVVLPVDGGFSAYSGV